jgi:hypothetical protein
MKRIRTEDWEWPLELLTPFECMCVACMQEDQEQATSLASDIVAAYSLEERPALVPFLYRIAEQRPFTFKTWIDLAEQAPTVLLKLSCLKMAVLLRPSNQEIWQKILSLCASLENIDLKKRVILEISLFAGEIYFTPEALSLDFSLLFQADKRLDMSEVRVFISRRSGLETYTGVPIRQFRDWLVTTGGVESRFGSYDIHWRAVWQPDWEQHIKQKMGALGSYDDFLQSLAFARLFFPAIGAHNLQLAQAYQQKHTPEKKSWFENKRIHTALGGLKVRSKSEVIIANVLTMLHIPFVYEQRLDMEDGTYRFPDFTVTWHGQIYYWEHLGMMENVQYLVRSDERLQWYREHGLAEALLVTTEVGGLDCDLLLTILQERLGKISHEQ